jgi:hypothetical protein
MGTPNSPNAAGVPAGSRLFLLISSDTDPSYNGHEFFGVFSADIWLMPDESGLNITLNTTDVNLVSEAFRGTAEVGALRLFVIPEPVAGTWAPLVAFGIVMRRRRPGARIQAGATPCPSRKSRPAEVFK